MFFSGDPSTRKRVDLGGRSSKERDRQKLLEQTRLDRNRRLSHRQQNSAALKIQKCYRGRKAVAAERARVRENFFTTYGKHFQNVNRQCFETDSDFLRQLLFFFNPQKAADFSALVETCRCLQQYGRESGNIVSLFAGVDYASKQALVGYRVKQLAYACIWAVHQNRNELKDQLFLASDNYSSSTVTLLESIGILVDSRLPWSCKTVAYLLQRNVYTLFRDIILTGKKSCVFEDSSRKHSSLEHVLARTISHIGEGSCVCPNIDPKWNFSSQILTIPLLWKLNPYLKEIFATHSLMKHYIHQMSLCVQNHVNVLPKDMSTEHPGFACLVGNLLEAAAVSFSQPNCSFDMAVDFAAVATFLLVALPPLQSSYKRIKENEDEMLIDDEPIQMSLNRDLEGQISKAIDSWFLQKFINVLFGGISQVNNSSSEGLHEKEMVAVGAACAFLHVTFNIVPMEQIITVLAYRTQLVPILWKFMKQCHETQNWSALSGNLAYLADAPGWLLPLSVFCPIYKYMLVLVGNDEFYEQEKPLSLKEMKSLIVILRQALWQLLWVNPVAPPNLATPTAGVFCLQKQPLEFIQHRVVLVASNLLSQLQDWNSRRQFTTPSDFHADGVNEHFMSQAMIVNTKANEILKHAPFLVPFTSRVKIFNSQLVAARQREGLHANFARNRIKVRRDHILQDAFDELNALSQEDLRGAIRITFVNEFGVEEAGIDGGGIFKDFMENVTRAAFDVQYGLFKETPDHLLYPNPGSGMIHEQHLQFFHFLGTVLAKAMFEGILVDIPFATFFLSKLKEKVNFLIDLPSLDPELYRHLIFLKHYQGDLSELGLYFVIMNNEYGEQIEEELVPDGRNQPVTNDNVIQFTYLVANYRLNYQMRQQSTHFLQGFRQLIQKEWIDMFNEHELQLLISGSVNGFDIDDLRAHANYAGGYHSDHYVIEVFWEVLKSFSLENQMKFLKFVTGCSRGPLLGFKFLEPSFCIQRVAGSATEEALDRLPTSATCMNLLKLPPYRSKQQLEEKLLYAISADAGFDLS